jgi:hypothetical protein
MSKCELFKGIAEVVWDRLASSNIRGERIDERGITGDRVVSTIQDYVEQHARFQIFAQSANDEVNTGGDLELYLEEGFQRFVRIMLQAKRSETTGQLNALNKFSGDTERRQYDTLMQYAANASCKPFYVVYNGIPNHTCTGNDCAGKYNEKQFGCAIVEPSFIKNHCESKKTGVLHFDPSQGPIGKPWRYLVCCDEEDFSEYRRYTKEEIDMDNHFKRIFTSPPPISFITSFGNGPRRSRIEMINDENYSKGWKPSARVFVTKNSKMKRQDGLLRFSA